MQVSELFRRGVVCPLDRRACDSLLSCDIDEGINVEKVLIDDDDDLFYSIWETGIFSSINLDCESMIDDYEDAMIEKEKVFLIIKILDGNLKFFDDTKRGLFFKSLRKLCDTALKKEMPLFFIF